MYRVFEGERPAAAAAARLARAPALPAVRRRRPASRRGQSYALALLAFSAFTLLVTYAIQRLQHVLPFNPQGLGRGRGRLAFNTAASFTTNTNWQGYVGESTMSYLTQMAGLAWHNFISAAAGHRRRARARARPHPARRRPTARARIGNFWVDLTRATVYVLLPISASSSRWSSSRRA